MTETKTDYRKNMKRAGNNILEHEIHWEHNTPHWIALEDGHASLEIMACQRPGDPWLQLFAAEHGEKSTKQTMLTLDRPAIEALRDLCQFALEESAQ